MADRLPPAPTDTRLARVVARLLSRWPFVFRSTLQMEVRRNDARIGQLRDVLHVREVELGHLRDNCRTLMRRLAPPVPDPRVTQTHMDDLLQYRVRVDFAPVYYQQDVRQLQYMCRPSDAWSHMTRGIARELAHHHARQVENEILSRLARIMPMRGGDA